jgi:general secretion pathway protein G
MTTRRGFTLIEVLVAATIIALLTAIGVVSYASANRSARDAKRKSDLEQIRAALEMFRADCGKYPVTNTVVPGNTLALNGTSCPGYSDSTVTYMRQVPQDPKGNYRYSQRDSGASYVLCACLEGSGGTTASCSNCGGVCGTGACNYEVCPP